MTVVFASISARVLDASPLSIDSSRTNIQVYAFVSVLEFRNVLVLVLELHRKFCENYANFLQLVLQPQDSRLIAVSWILNTLWKSR